MRYLQWLFLFAAIPLLFMGASTGESKFTEGIQPGSLAPGINWQELKLEEDNYVLLQFWAAYAPESRVMNVRMHNAIAGSAGNVRLLSVCMDEIPSVFEGVVSTDRLDKNTQWNEPMGRDSDLYRAYRLKNGFSNWLINSEGVIVARDVTPEKLKELV